MNLTKGILAILGLAAVVVGGRKVARQFAKDLRRRKEAEQARHLENVYRFRKEQRA